MSQEHIEIIMAMLKIVLYGLIFRLGMWVQKQGYFSPYKWKCPHEGCDFAVSGDVDFAVRRLGDDHLMHFHENKEEK